MNFENVNWLYVGLAVLAWLALLGALWKYPNASVSEQWHRFKRENPQVRIGFSEWLSMPRGPGSPTEPGRNVPIVGVSVVFWVVLALFVYASASSAP